METANHFLGYTYFFSGEVVEGNKLGRTLGYPTANLQIVEKSKLIPGDGVYAVDIVVSDEPDKTYRGMMNIGYRPTVDGSKKMIEVNIFQFDRDDLRKKPQGIRQKISSSRTKIQRAGRIESATGGRIEVTQIWAFEDLEI